MRAEVARAGKHYLQSPKEREKGKRGESRLASSAVPQELINVQKEVLEPKGGILFYQEAWLRGSVTWSG